MKRTFKFLMTAAAALAFAACTPNAEPEDTGKDDNGDNNGDKTEEVELNQNLAFTLEVIEIEGDQVKVKVQHNGEAKDTWYGFETTDVNENDATLIAAEIKRMNDAGKISGLKKQTSTTVTIRGLEPKTEYKFIVFGLSAEGEFYGTASSVKFTTARDKSVMEETNDWAISYQRGDNQGQVAEIFKIECADGNGFYFTTIDTYSLEANELTVVDYINYVIETEIPLLLSYGYKWADLYLDESSTLASPRMVHGDYIAIAIGFDAKGEPTGTYSSKEFAVLEETASAAYEQWLGTWDVTSEYKYEDEEGTVHDVSTTYTVQLSHYDNNNMYVMTGWEENGVQYDIRDYVGEYGIPVYFTDGNLEFRETTLDYLEFENAGSYYFGLYGVADITYQGKKYEEQLSAYDDMPMGKGVTEDNGQTGTITGLTQTMGEYTLEYRGMGYFAYTEDFSDLATWNGYLPFPCKMTKKAEEQGSTQQCLAISGDKDFRKHLVLKNRKSGRCAMLAL